MAVRLRILTVGKQASMLLRVARQSIPVSVSGAPIQTSRVGQCTMSDYIAPVGARLAKHDAKLISTDFKNKAVDPDRVDIVIYHADCPDGFAAAFCAWLRLGDQPQYIPLQHGPGLVAPDVAGKNVVVLDFSFNEATTNRLVQEAAGFLVIDHHASAQSALAALPDANKAFEMGQSGATLAWNYFQPGQEIPAFLRYVEDKDIWRWALTDSEAFTAGMGLVEKDFTVYRSLLYGGDAALDKVISQGKAIVQYQAKVRDGHVKRAKLVRLACAPAYVGLICNGSTLASEIGNAMCQVELPVQEGLPTQVQFGAIWEYDHEKKNFRVSLRSDSDEVDVCAMAKAYGGGGHRRAAGFTHSGGSVEDILLPVEGIPAGWKVETATARASRVAKEAAASGSAGPDTKRPRME